MKPRSLVEEEDGDDSAIPAWMEPSADMEETFPLQYWSDKSKLLAQELESLALGQFEDEDEQDGDDVVPSWMEASVDDKVFHTLHHWAEQSKLLVK